jgi:type IV pilus assembly protein PilA
MRLLPQSEATLTPPLQIAQTFKSLSNSHLRTANSAGTGFASSPGQNFSRGTIVSKRRAGFTLIELLIVVVIIGILAAIAIPKFASTKQKAYVTSMRMDLRNLSTAEEAYFFDNFTYADPNFLIAQSSFHLSPGNTVASMVATSSGWTATLKNSYVPSTAAPSKCATWVGSATPPFSADSIEGAPGCS